MSNFFVVFNQGSTGPEPTGQTVGTTKVAGGVKHAKFVKVSGTAVKDVQELVKQTYGTTDTPIVVTEAAWKSS